jgi:hypothetical protein
VCIVLLYSVQSPAASSSCCMPTTFQAHLVSLTAAGLYYLDYSFFCLLMYFLYLLLTSYSLLCTWAKTPMERKMSHRVTSHYALSQKMYMFVVILHTHKYNISRVVLMPLVKKCANNKCHSRPGRRGRGLPIPQKPVDVILFMYICIMNEKMVWHCIKLTSFCSCR